MEFVQRFISFEKLIAPTIIKIVYFIGLVLIVLGVLGAAVGTAGQNVFAGLGLLIVALPLAILYWRVLMELFLVTFGIFERMGEIKEILKKDGPPSA